MKTLILSDIHANAPALKEQFIDFLKNAFHKDLLKKDIQQMSINFATAE